MRVCFIHQNLPAQYRHLIAALPNRVRQLLAIGEQSAVQRWNARHPHLGVLGHRFSDKLAQAAVPTHLRAIHLQMACAEAVLQAVRQLLDRKLLPDLVVEAMVLLGALPHTPLLGCCESFYRRSGSDIDFDHEALARAFAQALQHPADTRALAMLDRLAAGPRPTAA